MLAIKFSIRTQAHKYLPVIVSVNIFLCEESFLFFYGILFVFNYYLSISALLLVMCEYYRNSSLCEIKQKSAR